MATDPSPPLRSRIGRFACALWLVAFAFVVLRRPYLFAATPSDLGRFSVFLVGYVIAPGVLAYRCFRRSDDWLMTFGMGWTFGYVLQALTYVALKAGHAEALFAYYPITIVAWWILERRSRESSSSGTMSTTTAHAPSLVHSALLLAICAVGAERINLYPMQCLHWFPHLDLLFHAGNAAEFAHHFPLLDPRFAGDRLTYHFFSYAFPAAAREVFGIPALDTLGCLAVPAMTALLAIQTFNAGRLVSRTALGGLAAAALVMFMTDWGYNPSDYRSVFNNLFQHGIYNSVTTCPGLILFATLAIAVQRWFADTARPSKSAALVLFALGFTASGIKGSVMPVVVPAAFVALAFSWMRRSDLRPRALAACAILTASALPMSLYLSLGENSYATSMFHLTPAVLVRTSSSFQWVATELGYAADSAPRWLALALTPVWLAGYLGLIGFCVIVTPRERRRAWREPEIFLLATCAVGLVAAWALAAPGQSQLFFLYNGQLALALLAGSTLALLRAPRSVADGARWLVVACLAFPFVVGPAGDVSLQWGRDALAREERSPTTRAVLDTITWLREKTPVDALIVRARPDTLLSAFAERRSYYEGELQRPEHHAWGWIRSNGSPYVQSEASPVGIERELVQRTMLEQPTLEHLRPIRAVATPGAPIYLLYDNFAGRYNQRGQIFVAARPLDESSLPKPSDFLVLEYESRTARVYRVVEPNGAE